MDHLCRSLLYTTNAPSCMNIRTSQLSGLVPRFYICFWAATVWNDQQLLRFWSSSKHQLLLLITCVLCQIVSANKVFLQIWRINLSSFIWCFRPLETDNTSVFTLSVFQYFPAKKRFNY